MQENGKREMDGAALVYATFPTLEAAEAAGRRLVEERLAACVNIIPGMVSIYRWEGAIERASEVVMVIKTRRERADAVIARVRRDHPYDNPALLIVPVGGGSADFLAWIVAECG